VQHNKDGVQNLFKQFGHFNLLLCLTFSGVVYAQSFEDFKRSEMKSLEEDKAQREKEFRSFLSAQWKAYKESQGLKVYEKPKPKVLPKTVEKEIVPVGPSVVIKVPKKPKVTIKKPVEKIPVVIQKPLQPTKPVKPVKPIKKDEKPAVKSYSVKLFDTDFLFEKEDSLKKAKFYPHNQDGITNFFDVLSKSSYQKTVDRLTLHVKSHKLNDWALYLLSEKLAFTLYKDKQEQKLFQWFILNQLGYDVKVALQDSNIILLTKSKKLIYSTPNYTLDKAHYYAIDYYNRSRLGSIKTYKGNYPDATKPLNLAIKEIPQFEQDTDVRELQFRYRGQKYSLHVKYNKNLIKFMQSYPQADYSSYFNAPLEYESSRSLISSLKPIINNRPASEAINILLFFVQHAFEYEVDQEQFGREKVMFAQETLYYKKSDCEDRAVLFAYLVKNLLGYDVVGIKYSDHMATAVSVPLKGDALNIASHRYVIADPTYVNAPIGKSMPKYKNIKPEKYIRVKASI
jgi:hypothetical protein